MSPPGLIRDVPSTNSRVPTIETIFILQHFKKKEKGNLLFIKILSFLSVPPVDSIKKMRYYGVVYFKNTP